MDNSHGTKDNGNSFELIASSDDDFGAGYKTCTKCFIQKPLDEFRVEPKGVMGRKASCKDCNSKKRIVKEVTRTGTSPFINDRIQKALEAAAYRIIKESM